MRRRRATCLVDESEGRSSTSTEGVGGMLGGRWVVVSPLTRNPPFGATRQGSVGSRRAGPRNCGAFPRFWDFANNSILPYPILKELFIKLMDC
jgi:hypothetical protein